MLLDGVGDGAEKRSPEHHSLVDPLMWVAVDAGHGAR